MKALMIGVENSIEKILMPRSIMKRSELIRLISLPELVSVRLFIDNLSTLSKSDTTSVLLALRVIWFPYTMYLFRLSEAKYMDVA